MIFIQSSNFDGCLVPRSVHFITIIVSNVLVAVSYPWRKLLSVTAKLLYFRGGNYCPSLLDCFISVAETLSITALRLWRKLLFIAAGLFYLCGGKYRPSQLDSFISVAESTVLHSLTALFLWQKVLSFTA
jgi:hypothetical protein